MARIQGLNVERKIPYNSEKGGFLAYVEFQSIQTFN